MEIRKDTYYTIYFSEDNVHEEKRAVKQAQKLIDKGYDFVIGSINENMEWFDTADSTGVKGLLCVQLLKNGRVKKL